MKSMLHTARLASRTLPYSTQLRRVSALVKPPLNIAFNEHTARLHEAPTDIAEFELGKERTSEGRHEVYLSRHKPTGKNYFLKLMGSAPLEQQEKEIGSFDVHKAQFLAEKEVCAGRLGLLFLGRAHTPNDYRVVINRKDGRRQPDYYVASQAVEHYKSLHEIDFFLSGRAPLFSVNADGRTRITINPDPRATILVRGRVLTKMVSLLLGESDENERNVGIRLNNDKSPNRLWEAGDMVLIDPECCFGMLPDYTAEQLAHQSTKSVFHSLELSSLHIGRRQEVKQNVLTRIATTDNAAIEKIFYQSFSPNSPYQETAAIIGKGFGNTYQLFVDAAQILNSERGQQRSSSASR
jgi:hypothetical protein